MSTYFLCKAEKKTFWQGWFDAKYSHIISLTLFHSAGLDEKLASTLSGSKSCGQLLWLGPKSTAPGLHFVKPQPSSVVESAAECLATAGNRGWLVAFQGLERNLCKAPLCHFLFDFSFFRFAAQKLPRKVVINNFYFTQKKNLQHEHMSSSTQPTQKKNHEKMTQ